MMSSKSVVVSLLLFVLVCSSLAIETSQNEKQTEMKEPNQYGGRGGGYGGGGGGYGGGGGGRGWGGGGGGQCKHGCCAYGGHGGCSRCCYNAQEATAFMANNGVQP